MEVLDCIRNRRSVRSFTDKKVEYDTIKELLEISSCAPTAQYWQPWGFVVIQDKEELKRLSDKGLEYIRANMDNLPHFHKYTDLFDNPDYNLFYDAQTLVIVYGDKDSHWYMQDCSLFTQNLILAAFDKGIGSCWIGFAEEILENDEFRKKYNVPDNYSIVAPMILGYIQKDQKPPKRRAPIIFNESI